MSHVAKMKHGLASGHSMPPPTQRLDKHERVPTHNYKLNQDAMYLDPITEKWFPATITHLLDAKRSYLIKTPEGVEYRQNQQHLKPQKCKSVPLPARKPKDQGPIQGRPKHDTKPPDKLDL